MFYYWKVRLYGPHGHYWHCQIKTQRDLNEINIIADFYHSLTTCKLLLEGMSEHSYENIHDAHTAFKGLFK